MDLDSSILKRLLIFVLAAGPFLQTSHANWIPPETVLFANQGLPVVRDTLKDVSVLSRNAIGLLHLPLGVAKVGLSPLPGPTIAGGLRDIGTGIRATSGLVQNTVQFPFSLLDRSLRSVGNISPLSMLGL